MRVWKRAWIQQLGEPWLVDDQALVGIHVVRTKICAGNKVSIQQAHRAVVAAIRKQASNNVTEKQCKEISAGERLASRDEASREQLAAAHVLCGIAPYTTRGIRQEGTSIAVIRSSREGRHAADPQFPLTAFVGNPAKKTQHGTGNVNRGRRPIASNYHQ